MSNAALGAYMEEELVSQPDVWLQAIAQAATENQSGGRLLPADGERVAVVGCGTSWFMAQSYAAAREAAALVALRGTIPGRTACPATHRTALMVARQRSGPP